MKARRYIEQNLALGPEELHAVTAAFDQAWEGLRTGYTEAGAEAARVRLAGIIIALAKQGILDGSKLHDMAVPLMTRPVHDR